MKQEGWSPCRPRGFSGPALATLLAVGWQFASLSGAHAGPAFPPSKEEARCRAEAPCHRVTQQNGALDFVRPVTGLSPALPVPNGPQQAGIRGKVTYRGAAAKSIDVTLRRYTPGAGDEVHVMTATTGTDGSYLFRSVPTLPSGQRYYVRYRNAGIDDRYLAFWFASDIESYVTGRSATGGDFDIEDVVLESPESGVTRSIPATFSWQRRQVATDAYHWRLMTAEYSQEWLTDPLGYVGAIDIVELPKSVPRGQELWWSINVHASDESFGWAEYRRAITFVYSLYVPRAMR